jgi:hypothetical protein
MDGADELRAFLAGRDVECPQCGYNLRGLRGAACPECGSALSFRMLRNLERQKKVGALDVRRARWGWTVVVVGFLLLIAGLAVGIVPANPFVTILIAVCLLAAAGAVRGRFEIPR